MGPWRSGCAAFHVPADLPLPLVKNALPRGAAKRAAA